MRTVITTVLALIGGLFAGILVSEIIGIIGFLLFDSIVGFRFLPVISAVVAAAAAVVVNARVRRRSAAHRPANQEHRPPSRAARPRILR